MSHRRTFIKLDEMAKGYNAKLMAWKKEIECDAKREEILECIQSAIPVMNKEMEYNQDISSSTISDIEKLSDDQIGEITSTNQERMIIDDPVEHIQIDQDFMELSGDSNTLQTQYNIGIDSNIRTFVKKRMGVHFDEQYSKI